MYHLTPYEDRQTINIALSVVNGITRLSKKQRCSYHRLDNNSKGLEPYRPTTQTLILYSPFSGGDDHITVWAVYWDTIMYRVAYGVMDSTNNEEIGHA